MRTLQADNSLKVLKNRIVPKVDELMARCDQLKASLVASGNTRRSLSDALLHEALEETLEPAKGHPQCVV